MRDRQYQRLTHQLIHYFGQTALLLQDNKAVKLVGIFDRVAIETLDIDNHQALFTVASQDLPVNLRDCLLQLDNQPYQIVGVQPDGVGMTSLILAEIT